MYCYWNITLSNFRWTLRETEKLIISISCTTSHYCVTGWKNHILNKFTTRKSSCHFWFYPSRLITIKNHRDTLRFSTFLFVVWMEAAPDSIIPTRIPHTIHVQLLIRGKCSYVRRTRNWGNERPYRSREFPEFSRCEVLAQLFYV